MHFKNLIAQVFDRIRAEDDGEKLLSKITCIPGDITEPNLGMSDDHQKILLDDVTVVFHSAATVKFNESLETAARLNTVGTHRVVLFCRQMTKLKVISHIGTRIHPVGILTRSCIKQSNTKLLLHICRS